MALKDWKRYTLANSTFAWRNQKNQDEVRIERNEYHNWSKGKHYNSGYSVIVKDEYLDFKRAIGYHYISYAQALAKAKQFMRTH